MKVALTQTEQEQLLQAALREDLRLLPQRVAGLLCRTRILSLEEAAAYYIYLEEIF